MAKDVKINGVTYEDVPAIKVPTAAGAEARFVDDDDLATVAHTGSASDLNSGILARAFGGTGRTDAVPLVYVATLPDTPEEGVAYLTPVSS